MKVLHISYKKSSETENAFDSVTETRILKDLKMYTVSSVIAKFPKYSMDSAKSYYTYITPHLIA